MGFYLITTMRVVPAVVRTSQPDDTLLGLPLPRHLANRQHARALASASTSAHRLSAQRANEDSMLSPGHSAPQSSSTGHAAFALGPVKSWTTGKEEDESAINVIRCRIPLADRHIQRLLDAVADWSVEHPSALPPPEDLDRLLLHKLHAHLPLDDGTHYALRLSVRTPAVPVPRGRCGRTISTCSSPTSPHSSQVSPRSCSSSSLSSTSSSHAPWSITAHVSIAPDMRGGSPPAVRLDTEPSRRFPSHPSWVDALPAFGVTHKTSARERYEASQDRVYANLTQHFVRNPRHLLRHLDGHARRHRSATMDRPPPGSTAALAERLVVADPTCSAAYQFHKHRQRRALSVAEPGTAHIVEGEELSAQSPDVDPKTRHPQPDFVFDALLWSCDAMGRTRLLESGIANLILEDTFVPESKFDRFTTPVVKARDGPLPGMLRAELLHRGLITEGDVAMHDLVSEPGRWRIYLCNAVRGVFEVELVQ